MAGRTRTRERRSVSKAAMGAGAAVLVIAGACSNMAGSLEVTRGSAGTAAEDAAAMNGQAVPAEFGLDERTANPRCRAPARPASPEAWKLERVFSGVTPRGAIAMAQRPGDGSRWFVLDRWGTLRSFPATTSPGESAVVAELGRVAGKRIATEHSGGALDFAFHPRFAENG